MNTAQAREVIYSNKPTCAREFHAAHKVLDWVFFRLVGKIDTHHYRTKQDLSLIEFRHPRTGRWVQTTSDTVRILAGKALRGDWGGAA